MSLRDTSRLSIVWEWHDGSYDRVHIQANDKGWTASGRHGDTRYLIELDEEFFCRSLEVSSDAQALTLNRTKAGWMNADAELIPGSADCVDLDLGWAALTNTFPIKRLMAAEQSAGTFLVMMISLPNLEVRMVKQSYSRQDKGWLYQNTESGYAALLSVDRHGFVTDYPELCTRKDLGR
ncbi:MAG: putative glycolipid-binding domain-containing protein [Tateyamaria sp.]|uniref:putative glycolipid-binding domain-containing protein n=1 Tax=Tateyamaria sp. TaxID=1929288 RepID=UPI0032692381